MVRQVPAEYPTVQAAVDASLPGDEVVVAAGIYEEQVVIDRNLTLTGAGIGLTVLLAPVNMPYEVGALRHNAVIHATLPADAVVVRDLSLEGDGRARSGTRFTGLMYDQVGGALQRLDVGGFHETPVSSQLTGIGLYCQSDPGDGLQILIEDVRFDRFQKSGCALFGSGCDFELRRVTADASELYSPAVINAFELGNGTRGSLESCTAQGAWYNGDPVAGTTACGFLLYYADRWTATELVSTANQSGIYTIAANVEITGATLTGFDQPLAFNYGIVFTGPGTLLSDTRVAVPRPTPLQVGSIPLVSALGIDVVLTDCDLQGEKLNDSVGMILYSSLDEARLQMNTCTVGNWDIGMLAAENGEGSVISRVRTTRFHDQLGPALASETFRTCDARGNHWGDPTGPFEPTLNPGGLGETVAGNILFTPWLEGNVVCAPLPLYIGGAEEDGSGYSAEITVHYLGNDVDPVYGFSTEVRWSPGKIVADAADVSRPDAGPFAAATLFQVLPLADGLRIDAALGGAQTGAATGDLFKVRLHLVGEPDYTEVPISLTVRNLRDGHNREIVGLVADDGLVIGDVQPPVISSIELTNSTLSHTDAFAKNGDVLKVRATVSEGDPFFQAPDITGNLAYVFGVDGYLRPPDSFDGLAADWAGLVASLIPADGPVPWSVTATDPAGNVATLADTFIADNTPPVPVSGLVANAGHNAVVLGWDEPAGLDANLRHLVVRSADSGAYPLYASPLPGYPAAPDLGDAVYTGLGKTVTVAYDVAGNERDILAFQAFAVDMVDLVSDTLAGSRTRATNYVLGDVTSAAGPGYDGVVDGSDLAQLDAGWGIPRGMSGFEAEVDVGPLDGGGLTGPPRPDGTIDLDDLMIFAHTYAPLAPPLRAIPTAKSSDPVQLAWSRPAPQVWVLSLIQPHPDLKGLHVTATLPAGVGATVESDSLLSAQTAPYYLRGTGADLDLTLAVLGPSVGVDGSGPLLRITLDTPVGSLDAAYDARSTANEVLSVIDAAAAAPVDRPAVFALQGNHPNPFNPTTQVVFELPSPQDVSLVIYALDGSRVQAIRAGRLPTGRHALTWRGVDGAGRSVAAGVYLYRLEAGPWSATGKMNLVR